MVTFHERRPAMTIKVEGNTPAAMPDPFPPTATLDLKDDFLPVVRILDARLSARTRVTLIAILSQIAMRQRAFFRFGPDWIWSDTQQSIAESIGVNASTVSRAIRGVTIATPHGVFPITTFVDSGVSMARGPRVVSASSVCAAIQRLVDHEAKSDPLSDQQIVDRLRAAGITVSRRTVAKYRSLSDIPASRNRRLLSQARSEDPDDQDEPA